MNRRSHQTRSPDYFISIEGKQISPELDARLISLTLVDKRGFQSDQLDITLANHDGRLALPTRGAKLSLAIGWKEIALIDRGIFIVDEVEHSGAPDQLTIRARAADMRNALPGKRSQSWHETTLAEILDSIASRHGLKSRVTPQLRSTPVDHIDQTDESDLHFLTRLAERYDADATIKAGHLLFIPQSGGITAAGKRIPPVTITRQLGDSHRYVVTDRNTYTGVIATWYDANTARRRSVLVGDELDAKTLRGNLATEADALTEAKAELQRMKRAGSTLSIELAEGLPNLYPETPVITQGFPVDIDDTPWVVVEVSHSISDNGYSGSVSLEVLGAATDKHLEEDLSDDQ